MELCLHIKLSPTIGKHPRAGEGGTREGPQVIEDRDPVPPLLGVVDKGTDVRRLTAVGDTWTEDHGVITWKNQNLINECQLTSANQGGQIYTYSQCIPDKYATQLSHYNID